MACMRQDVPVPPPVIVPREHFASAFSSPSSLGRWLWPEPVTEHNSFITVTTRKNSVGS